MLNSTRLLGAINSKNKRGIYMSEKMVKVKYYNKELVRDDVIIMSYNAFMVWRFRHTYESYEIF